MMCVPSISPSFQWFGTIPDVLVSNAQFLQPGEQPTTFILTLAVPAEAMYTFTGGGSSERDEL